MLDQSNNLLEEKYRELAQQTDLNRLLRSVFSPIESFDDCCNLLGKAEKLQQGLLAFQVEMIEAFRENEVTKTFPLKLTRDSSARGQPYLRWRNFADNVHGNVGFYAFIESMPQSDPYRENLLQCEKVRAALNMQIGIVNAMVSQLKRGGELMAQVEKESA